MLRGTGSCEPDLQELQRSLSQEQGPEFILESQSIDWNSNGHKDALAKSQSTLGSSYLNLVWAFHSFEIFLNFSALRLFSLKAILVDILINPNFSASFKTLSFWVNSLEWGLCISHKIHMSTTHPKSKDITNSFGTQMYLPLFYTVLKLVKPPNYLS